MFSAKIIALFVTTGALLNAATQHEVMRAGPWVLKSEDPSKNKDPLANVNQAAASLANPDAAKSLLDPLLPEKFKKGGDKAVNVDAGDFYCILHIVRWKQEPKDGTIHDALAQQHANLTHHNPH